MKKLCALFFLSTTVSACVMQEGYYMDEDQYDRPPVVVVDNNARPGPRLVHGRYYHHRARRYSSNAPAVVVVPPSNAHGPHLSQTGPSGPTVVSNAPGPRPVMPRSGVRGHPHPRSNSPEVVLVSP